MTTPIMHIAQSEAKPEDLGRFYEDTGAPIVVGDNTFSIIDYNGRTIYFETLEAAKEYTQGE